MNDDFRERAAFLREFLSIASQTFDVYITVSPDREGFIYVDGKTGQAIAVAGAETTLGGLQKLVKGGKAQHEY